jgi:hypothetical protein
MSAIDEPRTAFEPGTPSSAPVITSVTCDATSGAECPIHSATSTSCGSDRSGIASRASPRCAA